MQLDMVPGSPVLFVPVVNNINCKYMGAESCDLVQVDMNILLKSPTLFFLDGYIYSYFKRVKTYQLKGNYLSVWVVNTDVGLINSIQ